MSYTLNSLKEEFFEEWYGGCTGDARSLDNIYRYIYIHTYIYIYIYRELTSQLRLMFAEAPFFWGVRGRKPYTLNPNNGNCKMSGILSGTRLLHPQQVTDEVGACPPKPQRK